MTARPEAAGQARPEAARAAWPEAARELVGVLHVHTTYSDGTGTPDQVAAVARGCGLDFLGINDHMSLGARHEGLGGHRGGIFVLAGAEVHEHLLGGHHMLVYGMDELPAGRRIVDMISGVNSSGGLALAAHPCERRGYLPLTHSMRWRSVPGGLGGVEVWNFMSQWKAGVTPFDLARRLKCPDGYVAGPTPDTVRFWERAGGCAIAGSDAHAFILGAGRSRKIAFPYEMLFSRLRTHILLDHELPVENDSAETALLDALRRGRCFASNALLGNAKGFRAFRRGSILELRLPEPCQVAVRQAESLISIPASGTAVHTGISADGPVVVELLKGGRTWAWCGLA
jgi:hypothetical protein